MLARVWRKANTLALLVGMQIDTATMEDGMERNGNPFQSSCLENPMEGEAW